MINRDDMLELTRRMTPSRTCFDRIAGAYINDTGEIEDSFNIHFGKLQKHWKKDYYISFWEKLRRYKV